MTPALAVRGIDVDLAGTPVLRHVDLTVSPGEFVALLGSNGSGKSTLVRAAVGLLPASCGSIELFGTPLAQFRDRRRLGYVPQRSAAAGGVPATIREVVTSGRLARRRLVGRATRADRTAVDRAIDQVGLSERARSSWTELSGGQQQRVLIARALAAEPELLVMDEPTAGVDREHAAALADLLATLVGQGSAVLLVAHELGPMRPAIDRAVVMRAGEVAYDGPVDHIDDDHTAHTHAHTGEPPFTETVPGEGVW